MCRSVTLAGGLLLLIWSENDRKQRSEDMGLPSGMESTSSDRLQLCGLALPSGRLLFAPPFLPSPAGAVIGASC